MLIMADKRYNSLGIAFSESPNIETIINDAKHATEFTL